MADVVMNFGANCLAFSNDAKYASLLVKNIEQRWHNCGQPLFILAFLLYPSYYQTLKDMDNDTDLTRLVQMCKFALFYYRVFLNDDTGQLREEVVLWWDKGSSVYGVEDPKEFSTAVRFWEYVNKGYKGTRLAPLALVILVVVINTATCKRLFSEFALIHNARRNRLSENKMKLMSIVR